MNYTTVVLGGVLRFSIAWYCLSVYGGVHWFTGLVPNIDEDFREAESGAILVDGKMIGETSMAKVVW